MSVARWEFEHARRFPDETGLIFAARSWTNAQLHAQSRRFAAALLRLGVLPGDRVAIALGNSPELYVACSGAVIAGAAMVVLGDSFSSELQAKVAHCEPRVLVCSSHLTGVLAMASPHARLVSVGGDAPSLSFDTLLAQEEPLRELVPVSNDTLAQLCYTSGSTGRPKAVPYTHGGVDKFLNSFADMLPDRHTLTTVLVCVPPTAFVSRLVTLRVLANNRYVLLPQFEAERALEAIQRYGVQQMSLLPTMAEQLVACGARKDFDCASLRSINIGGSHVPRALVSALERLASNEECKAVRVAVQYGMTEAGGGIAMTTEGGDGVVGKLSPGVVVRIGRPDGTDTQPGEVGEIIARTPFAPAGYWRDPEQSAGVFRNGFVHTGDLGYVQEDGQLCLVGRNKDVIIQGGVNVHPAELIEVIYAIPGVRECAVVGCPNEVLGEEVVACVVRVAGAEPGEPYIRARCRLALDPAKQPVRILFFAELPKKDGGKVDLAALRGEVATQTPRTATGVEAVRGAREAREVIEHELRTILLDELARSETPLDPQVPFGELGLSSQGAVRLAYALRERLGVDVPATLAYACPTIEACSQWLISRHSASSSMTAAVDDAAPPVAQSSTPQAIAIVGMGVRLPGRVGSPEELWELLCSGREVVDEVPSERRAPRDSDRRPDTAPWRAAFLANAADFDAEFFRLSSEAAEIDPRHRQMLEVCWEALENAGLDPTALPGERTGVFLGLSGERYATPNPLGAAVGMAAGYLCHFFDFRGPVATFDTTCSSSLVAMHHARQSLQHGECDLAIVASANLLCESRAGDPLGVMSSDGRTRAFDASASGFGQGEGTLVLVLKRLDDAVRAGDRVYACVLGSAINHDGRSSSLTAPNPRSQARLIALALQTAGVSPQQVQYVEAHGTGTRLGDPIEVDGIVTSLGSGRRSPLYIGSIKSNIGHLEAAAGLAGLAKVALSIWHRRLPASRHCTQPNPGIPWSRIPVRVQSSPGDWPEPRAQLVAGVSAFGMSGTNAHAVLAEPPEQGVELHPRAGAPGRWLLPISARSEAALRTAVQRWIEALAREDETVTCRDIAYSASCRRAHHPFRIAVHGGSRQEWIAALRERLTRGGALAKRTREPRKLAVVFSGQGSQWPGMAMELLAQEPVFRDTLTHCAQLIQARAGWSVIDELRRDKAESRLEATEITQPALFAVQVALYELWRSWGVEAAAAVGHSAGEVAGAHAAGLLTLEEGVQVICERGRVCSEAPGGLMLAAALSPAEAEELCNRLPQPIEIAAINSPRSLVLSGSTYACQLALDELRARGVRVVAMPGAHAFHSSLMQRAAFALRRVVVAPPARRPRLSLISGMTAAPLERLDGDYWSRQLRECVRFCGAVHTLLCDGCTTFLEVGPHPVLIPAIHEVFVSYGYSDAFAVGSLRRGAGGVDPLLESLGTLYCEAAPVSWARCYEIPGRHVDLPVYPWEHRRYWLDSPPAPAGAPGRVTFTACKDASHTAAISSPAALLRDVLTGLIDRPLEELREDCSLQELAIDSLGLVRLGMRLAIWTGGPAIAPAPEATLGDLLNVLGSARPSGADTDMGPGVLAATSPVRWLRRVGEQPTHVWIHPAGGGVDCYRLLAQALPFRSVALDSPVVEMGEGVPATVEELAAEYLRHLERAGLRDSLLLAGWSFGGVIAFEMAVQLARQGRRVAQVVLIDSWAAGAALPAGVPQIATLPLNVPADLPAREREILRSRQRLHLEALRQYRPDRYRGRVLSLRAVPTQGDPDGIWRQAASDLEVHPVRGDHFSIMGPAAMEELVLALAPTREPTQPGRVTGAAHARGRTDHI